MKCLIIYNPKSGMTEKNELDAILNYVNENKWNYRLYLTEADLGPNEILGKESPDVEVIISCGGDGTISQTISGMHKNNFKCPLLVVPSGTTNEISQNLGLDNEDITDVLQRLDDFDVVEVDYGLINNDKTFTYALTFGNFTEVTYKTPQTLKNWIGYRAYVLYGFLTFRKIYSYHIALKTEDINISGNYVFGAISNSKSMGNIFKFDEHQFALDDGVFEVLLIKKPRSVKDLRLILKGMIDNNYEGKMFTTLKAKNIKIRSGSIIDWNIDGEFGGSHKEIEIKNLHKKIKLIV